MRCRSGRAITVTPAWLIVFSNGQRALTHLMPLRTGRPQVGQRGKAF
jgi:hypothetical protein